MIDTTTPWPLLVAVFVLGCSPDSNPPSADAGDEQADLTAQDVAATDVRSDAAGDVGSDAPLPDMPATSNVPFDEAVFIATHNSYSGSSRGTIAEQLEGGARFIEFDVHADLYSTNGYEVGHDEPGHEVELGGGNPDDVALTSWLAIVTDWRSRHPTHLPLTIGIDVKDALSSRTHADGNTARLNALMLDTFGAALFTEAEASAGWPTVEAMRGRVLVVLSGDTATRLAYRRTTGSQPAVAANASQVVVAHTDGTQSRIWAGTTDGMLNSEPAAGTDPAVALADDGTVVWFSVVSGALQIRTGLLEADGTFTWDADPEAFTDTEPAMNPSVRFVGNNTVREIHETAGGILRHWSGSWDPATRMIAWASETSSDPRYDETTASGLSVTSDATPPYAVDVLHLDDGSTRRRVRLQQRMWSESQFGGPAEFEDDAVFFFAADAFGSSDVAWAQQKRSAGGIVRLWKFNLPNVRPEPPVTYPATDFPSMDWYVDYCRQVRCIVE